VAHASIPIRHGARAAKNASTWLRRSCFRTTTLLSRVDGENQAVNETIELYHVEGLNHSDNMAIVYLPKEKIVINADLYGPPAAGGNLPNVNANSVALFRNLKRLKLDVAQHVPIHGNPGPNADFERIVGPVAAPW
jgi:hypothetical protein